MKDYANKLFDEITEQIINKGQTILRINISEEECISLQYHLTRHSYYAVIIDDYPYEIIDKVSLLEALYYQVRLITMHDLNWDALEEALNDALNNFFEFEGICLLFRNKGLKTKLIKELSTLTEIVGEINKQSKQKQINLLVNQ